MAFGLGVKKDDPMAALTDEKLVLIRVATLVDLKAVLKAVCLVAKLVDGMVDMLVDGMVGLLVAK